MKMVLSLFFGIAIGILAGMLISVFYQKLRIRKMSKSVDKLRNRIKITLQEIAEAFERMEKSKETNKTNENQDKK